MKNRNRIYASSLIYALILIFLITIISYSIILLNQYRLEFVIKAENQSRLIDNSYSAMNLISSKLYEEPTYTWTGDLYGNENDSVLIKSYYSGILQVNISNSFSNSQHYSCSSFSGPNMDFSDGLILDDSRYNLKVAGETQIKGGCIVPNQRIERANISNYPYSGDKLAWGSIKPSSRAFPELNSTIKDRLKYLKTFLNSQNSKILNEFDSLDNSFNSETISFIDSSIIHIQHSFLKNNIIISSNKEIDVFANNTLIDILLIAPIVRIEKGFKGSVQIIASDSIFIGEEVFLSFPSVLILNSKNEKSNYLKVEQSCRFQGIILSSNENKEVFSSMEFESGFLMEGLIYNNGGTSIKDAQINGQLITKSVNYKSHSSSDINTLVNVKIWPDQLSNKLKGLNFIGEIEHQKIIKWL